MPQCRQCGRGTDAYEPLDRFVRCPSCAQMVPPPVIDAPVRTTAPSWSRFPVTTGIVALNVAVFVAMVATGTSPTNPEPEQLLRWGAMYGPAVIAGQYWRLLTSMFIHIGLLHLGFNMWAFWNLGQLSEAVLGKMKFPVIYLVSGACGSLLSLSFRPGGLSAGASGAIFGAAGALIAVLKYAHLKVPREALKPILKSVSMFALYNLAIGAVVPQINNLAHFGGLVSGFVFGLLVAITQRRPEVA